jgi:hypothetical protein
VPISLYSIPSQLHHVLRHYKDAPRAGLDVQAICMLMYFLALHQECIESVGGAWDFVTNVPSSSGRSGTHPLVKAMAKVPALHAQYRDVLTRGPGNLGHLIASDDGFTVTAPIHGQRVLLVDDTYTSGARAQSAASAIALAGGIVSAVVPVGRVINPQFSPTTKDYWSTCAASPFDWAVCCVH